ncbi:MAG: hypothetical protein KO202_04745 [Methanobacteriaceae archaeon]|jgi:Cdc6-like AAA superfamily ATPase|nr:hypothetical protein [Methanobacteriaceae archaeon]
MLLKGKNASLKTYFRLINERFENIKTVYINCQHYRTEYTIISKIYKEINNKNPDLSGLSTMDIYNKVIDYLLLENKVLIIAFDDYGLLKNVKELNKTFYSLCRTHETFKNVQVSLITISSLEKNIALDPLVSTIYLPIEIKFPFYRREEIFHIRKQRCYLGFYPNVISEDTIEKIAKNTFWKVNLRYGIKTLLELGEKAELNYESKIKFNLLFY